MNQFKHLFLGFLLTFFLAWLGLVVVPYFQIGQLEPHVDDLGDAYPPQRTGIAERGKAVYKSHGCVYCHTQQVMADYHSADIERGWGKRRTVARDYIYDTPALLGNSRMGPDLTNIGDGTRVKDTNEMHLHLYNPQMLNKWSIMPSYTFLYKKQKIVGEPSPDALQLKEEFKPEEGYEIVPTEEARELVAYLLSLKVNYDLPEALLPEEKEKKDGKKEEKKAGAVAAK